MTLASESATLVKAGSQTPDKQPTIGQEPRTQTFVLAPLRISGSSIAICKGFFSAAEGAQAGRKARDSTKAAGFCPYKLYSTTRIMPVQHVPYRDPTSGWFAGAAPPYRCAPSARVNLLTDSHWSLNARKEENSQFAL